jgi:hypothetical protein
MDLPPLPVAVPDSNRKLCVGFWLSWSINAVAAAIVFYFFFAGLADGSVSSFNGLLWAGLLTAVALVVLGSLYLRAIGKLGLGLVVNLLLAVPGLFFALFFLVLLTSHGRWN